MAKPVENRAKKLSNVWIYCVCRFFWRIGSVIGSVKQEKAHPARGKMGWNAWFYWVFESNRIRNRLTLLKRAHRRDFRDVPFRLLFSPVFNLMYLAVKPLWALTFLVFSCCDACCFCRTICRSAGTTFVLAVNPLSYICRICCRSTTNMKKLLLRLCRKSSFTWEIVLKRIWIFPDCYRLL